MQTLKTLSILWLLSVPTMNSVQKTIMTEVKSNHSFSVTVSKLESAINDKGLNIFAIVDHAAAAEKAGLTLRPTTLIIFGNPKVGTLLMQADQTLGIELPLKILVRELESGVVLITYKNPELFEKSYSLESRAEVIQNVKKALAGLSAAAAN